MHPPWCPHPYRYLVVKSGTTVGQHHMSSVCGLGCCFVRCTPQVEASAGQEMYYNHVSLTFDQNVGKAELLVNSLQLIWAQTYLPPYRYTLWTFLIFVFVNATHMVVKSDTIVYMCMEFIICWSDRSPGRLMISNTPSIGGASNHLRWEKECGVNSPGF